MLNKIRTTAFILTVIFTLAALSQSGWFVRAASGPGWLRQFAGWADAENNKPQALLKRAAKTTAAAPAMFATIIVNSNSEIVNASDGACTLREAITAANTDTASGATAGECAAGAGTDTIQFDSGVTSIGLSAPLFITAPVIIDGLVGRSVRAEINGTLVNGDGLIIQSGAGGSTISGLTLNRFSVAGSAAIKLEASSSNIIRNCLIGTDTAGASSVAGNRNGVIINGGGSNTIGGSTAGDRNIISNNRTPSLTASDFGVGVIIRNTSLANNRVQGNYIGLDANGQNALPNDVGVWIESADNVLIGGTSAGERNIISGNNINGVRISSSTSDTNNAITGNYFGVNFSATAARGNGAAPPASSSAAAIANIDASNTRIGGSLTGGEFNLIANQLSGPGILVTGATATGVDIRKNDIFANVGGGIDLNGDGITPNDANDPDTGPNNRQNFPVITAASISGSSVNIQGTLNSTPGTNFRIEFFSSPTCPAVPQGRFIGDTNVATDGSGNATFNVTFVPTPQVYTDPSAPGLAATVQPGSILLATAIKTSATPFDTSEFSACFTIPCTYSISPSSVTIGSPGGTNVSSVTITAAANCGWTATSNAPWISFGAGNTATTTGTGTTQIFFNAQANVGLERSGTITLTGTNFSQVFTVTQSSGCAYSLSTSNPNQPTSATFPPAGGSNTVNVTTLNQSCTWTAASNASWITVTSPIGTVTGNGSVSYTVAANTGQQRTGTMVIANAIFTVTQESGCAYTITVNPNPAGTTFPATSTTFTATVATSSECTWAASATPGIVITSGQSGQGNGTVNFTLEANNGPARAPVITIAGQTFTLNQATGCTYLLSPASRTFPASSGSDSFTVTPSNSSCTWTAVPDVPWISVTSGGSGTGNGTVSYTVQANTGPTRTGMINVAGQTHIVTQDSGCTYSLSSISQTFTAPGGSGTVNVTASNALCPWAVTVPAQFPWITVTSSTSNTGSSTVSFTVAANTGAPRTGTITIAGQTFTVTQESGCTFTLSSTGANFTPPGGTGTVSVTASDAACTWTATSNAAWLTITSGASSAGSGMVNFTVAANNGPQRTGTLTIAGLTYTVTQDSNCSYTLSSSGQTFTPAGGNGAITVTASDPACTWTAVTTATWITITSGASSTGSGSTNYTVAANTGPQRSAVITIAGRTFTVTQESGCTFTINPTSQSFTATGGNGTITITVSNADCAWTALSNANWITVTAPSNGSGQGNGSVSFTVAANTGLLRTGTITVAGQTFTVSQESGCTFTLSALSQNFAPGGGTGSVNVTASTASCAWLATSTAPWITVTGGANSTGNATVSYTVAANTGPQRTGTIVIAGQTYTVTQDSNCSYTLSATNQNFGIAGGNGSVTVTASDPACTWTAVSNAPWITVSSGGTGAGNGTVFFSVAANLGPARNGTITIAGRTFAVAQESGCTFSLSAINQNFQPAGGTGSVTVTASDAACTWTAVTTATWITITSAANNSGTGTVNFTVAANPGAQRTGLLTIAGQTFTVTQGGGCTFTLSPNTAQNFTPAGGNGTVTVTTGPGCQWMATSTASWLTVTSGINNTGDGTVTYSVLPNNGPQRTGTIIIAGLTFTVTQDSNCSYTLSATNQNFAAAGGNGSVSVSTSNPACTWTIVSNAAWLTVLSGVNSTGNGQAAFSVAANGGPARTGTLTVAGQTLTITQDSGCTFTLNTVNQNFPPTGGGGSVSVTTGPGCTWTAVSNAAWITLPANAGGTGNGSVNFTVAANDGPPRTGTITVAGQTLTITQETGCSFTINPTTQNFPVTGGNGTVAVTASSNSCTWTATSTAAWITVTSGASSAGNGTVAFSVAANTGPQRTGTITIAGRVFTVTQDSNCSFTINPGSQQFGPAGGNGAVTVTASNAACAWTAVANVTWLSITAGANGTGNGSVAFAVAANTGATRTGTLTVAGQTFTVTQEGGCTYSISPTAQNFGTGGGSGTVNITTGAGCQWTAASNASWIAITSGLSGTGNGATVFAVAINNGGPRTGTLTIAGQTFTVTQNGGCSFTISPTSRDFTDAGGGGSVAVTAADAGCTWAATSNVAWITIGSGAGGSGNGTVSYAVAANASFARTGTLTIAGQIHTVTQSAGNSRIANFSAASFSGTSLTPDGIVAAFGNDLATSTQFVRNPPLPTNLAGTTVRIRDSNNIERLAQLFFVSPTQVNYLIPAQVAFGQATVTITSGNGNTATGSIIISRSAPGLFAINGTGQGLAAAQALRVRANGQQVFEAVAVRSPAGNSFVAVPIDLGPATEQVFLVLFGTGIRNRNTANPVTARLGGTAADVTFAGAQGTLVGLDQVNVRIPRSLIGRGEIDVLITVDGQATNTVKVSIR